MGVLDLRVLLCKSQLFQVTFVLNYKSLQELDFGTQVGNLVRVLSRPVWSIISWAQNLGEPTNLESILANLETVSVCIIHCSMD